MSQDFKCSNASQECMRDLVSLRPYNIRELWHSSDIQWHRTFVLIANGKNGSLARRFWPRARTKHSNESTKSCRCQKILVAWSFTLSGAHILLLLNWIHFLPAALLTGHITALTLSRDWVSTSTLASYKKLSHCVLPWLYLRGFELVSPWLTPVDFWNFNTRLFTLPTVP